MKPRGLIVRRELRRQSRRWQLVVLRGLPPLLLVVLLAIVIGSFGERIEVDRIPNLGRSLYRTAALGLIALVAFAVPASLARAVQLERDEGTLDLLALTGVSSAQALFGTVGTTLFSLLLVVLGTMPFVALIPTLGGVAPGEVFSLIVLIPAVAVVLGAVGAMLGLVSRSVALPLLMTGVFALTFGLLLPIRFGSTVWRVSGYTVEVTAFFPITMAFHPQVWIPWGVIPWLIVAAVAVFVAAWRFRRDVSAGWEPRGKAWPGPAYGWVIHVPIVAAGMLLYEGSLLVAGDGTDTIFHGIRGFGTEDQVNAFIVVGMVVWVSSAILFLRASAWLIPRLSLPRTRRFIPVFGNPVVWRELFTTAYGGMARALWILTFAWVVIAALLIVGQQRDLIGMWGALAAISTLFLTVLLLGTSITDERRRGTLQLLCSATMAPWRIVAGKLLAVAARVLPMAILGLVVISVALPDEALGLYAADALWRSSETHWGQQLLNGWPYVRLPAIVVWVAGFWCAAASASVALAVRVRSLVLAWAAPMAIFICSPALAIGCLITTEYFGDRSVAAAISTAVFPLQFFLQETAAGIPVELVVSSALWWTVAVVCFVLASRWMGRWGPRVRR